MEIINVMAASVDSYIAAEPIESDEQRQKSLISCEEDHKHLLKLMKDSDAILVGASSIRANEECLELKNCDNPDWYIFTNSEIPSTYNFWQQNRIQRTLISTNSIKIHNAEVVKKEFLQADKDEMVHQTVKALKDKGYKRVLLFGGGMINSWFYRLNYVDSLVLTVAPVLIGAKNGSHLVDPELTHPVELSLESSKAVGSFLFLKYRVNK